MGNEIFQMIQEIQTKLHRKNRVLVAIDGRCGSGKSTLAEQWQSQFSVAVVHTDDFYLPMCERAVDWKERIAGNMDLERLEKEILHPFRAGVPVMCRPYDCHKDRWKATYSILPRGVLLVEGSYAQHPILKAYYDVTIFLTCTQEEQRRRLEQREGKDYTFFEKLWIPKEEQYFDVYSIAQHSDYIWDTTA